MSGKKYKVTNTTVKERPKDGPDKRTLLEKEGYRVQFRKNTDSHPIQLYPKHKRHTIIDWEPDEGMLRMARGGMISIDEIGDVTEALKDHTLREDATAKVSRPKQSNIESAGTPYDKGKAKAVEMGKPDQPQRSGLEMEGAVNPDGDPNFVVKAKHDGPLANPTEHPAAAEPQGEPDVGMNDGSSE